MKIRKKKWKKKEKWKKKKNIKNIKNIFYEKIRETKYGETTNTVKSLLPVAHTRTQGNVRGHILYYYYSKKKAREKAGHAQNILLVRFSSGHFRMRMRTCSLPVAPPPQVRLELYPYTTDVSLTTARTFLGIKSVQYDDCYQVSCLTVSKFLLLSSYILCYFQNRISLINVYRQMFSLSFFWIESSLMKDGFCFVVIFFNYFLYTLY